ILDKMTDLEISRIVKGVFEILDKKDKPRNFLNFEGHYHLYVTEKTLTLALATVATTLAQVAVLHTGNSHPCTGGSAVCCRQSSYSRAIVAPVGGWMLLPLGGTLQGWWPSLGGDARSRPWSQSAALASGLVVGGCPYRRPAHRWLPPS
ncbi:hypothetical protein B296_00023659, partial [Ensete ventricosum]